MNDHARGCEGREYTCTCGYDAERGAEIKRMREALEKIDLKAEAGLCAGTHNGARAFHEDIRCIARAALPKAAGEK